MGVVLLQGVVMRYAWGRHELIARLQGRVFPTDEPEAELWFGAHKSGSSRLDGAGADGTLSHLLASNPTGWLGSAVADTFAGQLPFLVKVLAVNEPLSLQLHPDAACVAALVAAGDPEQVLADRHPKPEMVVALGELHALAGFLHADEAAEIVAGLATYGPDAPWQAVYEQIVTDGVMAAVQSLIGANDTTIAALLGALHTALADGFSAPNVPALTDLLRRYPSDRSVAIAVLMRLFVLADGDALYIPPGVLHCYLSGAGVEVMASSDNVVRVGLTHKPCHPEVVSAQLATATHSPEVVAVVANGALRQYPVETEWFGLARFNAGADSITLDRAARGPQILVNVCGQATVTANDGATVTLPAGMAVFVAAGQQVSVTGDADVFVARVGD